MAIFSAQAALGIIKSLFAPNPGPHSFCPLYMFFVAFCLVLRERSGRPQPPAEWSPCRSYARSEFHTQLANMSFDEIFDLTAGVCFIF